MVKLPRWAVLLIFLTCWPAAVLATPIFSADADGARIVLTDEPCALDAVTNLKYRATWTEKGKTFEGCWAPRTDMGVVIAYWSDKTAVAMPIQAFTRVSGA